MKVFITGDRSMTPFYPGFAAVEMLRALGGGDSLATGSLEGVEAVVRELASQADVPLEQWAHVETGEGKPDFDELFARLAEDADVRVVVIHFDPAVSSVVAALFRHFDDDRVTLRSPADLMG